MGVRGPVAQGAEERRGASRWATTSELGANEAGLSIPAEPRPNQKRLDNLSNLLLNSPFAGAGLDLDRPKDFRRGLRERPIFENSRYALYARN